MKKLILFVAILLGVLAVNSRAQKLPVYTVQEFNNDLPYATTNNIVIDVTGASAVSIVPSMAGIGAHTVTAIVGVTNSANATNGQTLTLTVGGTAYAYTWTNVVTSTQTNLSSPYTNIVIGITNATLTNGMTLTVVKNAQTNLFTWATAASATTDIQTNTSPTTSATNLYSTLLNTFDLVTVNSNAVTIRFAVGDRVLVSDSGGWGTNASTATYSVTNIVSTNTLQVASTNSAANAATNLYTKLSTDQTNLIVTYANAVSLSLVTIGNPGFTLATTGIWSTNLITTNAIAGSVYFYASNSLDKVTWFRNAAQDFSLAYSTTANVSGITNFTSLPHYGYISYRIENAATNYSQAAGFILKAATKKGL